MTDCIWDLNLPPRNGSDIPPMHVSMAKASDVLTSNSKRWRSAAPL